MRKDEAAKKRNEILKLPYLVLTVSLLVTLGATYLFYQNSQLKDQARFAAEVNKTKTIIENKLQGCLAMLRNSRAYVESNPKIDRRRFGVFVNNLELKSDYQGVQDIGYIEAVAPGARKRFIRKMNADGVSAFKVYPERPVGKDENLYVVAYLEPSGDGNQKIIGQDLAAEAASFDILNEARDNGRAAASGKTTFIQSDDFAAHSGFSIYLPVYRNGNIPQNPDDRKRLLRGFVYSSFRAADFLNDVQRTIATNALAIAIYDAENTPENILARTFHNQDASFSTTNEINVADRRWIVQYASLPEFEAQSSTNLTPLIFISGFVFSLLLFGMTYLETDARAHSEKIAANLRVSESEKARLLESEQKARHIAERANHAKDEFITNVSHELRTPLNSIAGWTKILQAENISPATKQQALRRIDKNLRTQIKIIEDLLDFSELTSGFKPETGGQAVEFADVFEQAIKEMSPAAAEKGLALEKINALNGEKVYGSNDRFKKVVKNLLSNAIKFTASGGKIVAEARVIRETLELKITDNGQGIAASFLPHIFEHFKQADSSITKQHGGLGMGLAISQQIVEAYGGEIEAASEGEGKGTVLTVRLPIISEPSEQKSLSEA